MKARVKRDVREVSGLPGSDAIVSSEGDLPVITANVTGPPDTPYAGYVFRARILLPEEFPFKSPSVGFVTKVWHPNIDFASGSVCLDVLNDKWSPSTTLASVFQVLLPQLLASPDPTSPLNQDAAAEMMAATGNPFIARAREETMKRAVACTTLSSS